MISLGRDISPSACRELVRMWTETLGQLRRRGMGFRFELPEAACARQTTWPQEAHFPPLKQGDVSNTPREAEMMKYRSRHYTSTSTSRTPVLGLFLLLTVGAPLAAQPVVEFVDFTGSADRTHAPMVACQDGTGARSLDGPELPTDILGDLISCVPQDDIWCPDVKFEGRNVEIPVFRSRRLVFQNVRAGELPATINAQVFAQRHPDPGKPAAGGKVWQRTRQVEVTAEGRMGLDVPDGLLLNLRLVPADGRYAPRYFSAFKQTPASLRFVEGSSIMGQAFSVETGQPMAGVVVSTGRHFGLLPDEQDHADRQVIQATTGEDGFFQLAGLPEGNVELVFEPSDTKHSVVRRVDYVPAGHEVGPMEVWIEPKTAVSIAVEPAGFPWRVALRREGASPAKPSRIGSAGPNGLASFDGVSRGKYEIEVFQGDEDNRSSFYRGAIDIRGEQVLTVPLDVVELRGTVRIQGEPARAHVTVETGSDDQTHFETDEGGDFSALIRRPEHRYLHAYISAGDIERFVEVRPVDLDEDARVLKRDLEIKGVDVRGRLLTQTGGAVPEGEVTVLSGPNRVAMTKSNRDGEFTARLLPLGEDLVMAARHLRFGASDPRPMRLSEGDKPWIELQLYESRTVSGRVMRIPTNPTTHSGAKRPVA